MDYTPVLCDNVFFAKIENSDHYFVHQLSNDVRLRINAQTHYLLKLMDGKKTLRELAILLNDHFDQHISTQEVDRFIKNTLQPSGIIKTEQEIIKKARAPYFNLRITLIPHALVTKITRYFQFLIFNRIWYVTGLLLITLGIVYANTISFQAMTHFIKPAHILWYLPLSVVSCLVHELGHASACEKFGMKAGSVGFGFYILMPVFYADVSNAWSLSTPKRIIINIAGMYFQLLLSGILVLVYALTTNEWMLYASLINIISFLPNLNPFVRYDGYWILSDGLGINNLMQKAAKSYRQTIVWIRNKMTGESPVKTATGKFLVAYYVANKIMVLVFLLVFVVFNGHAVLYFPYRLLHIIYSLVMKQEALSFNGIKTFITGNLVSILFYILLGRLIKNSSLRKGQAHRQWSVTNKKTIVKTDTMG